MIALCLALYFFGAIGALVTMLYGNDEQSAWTFAGFVLVVLAMAFWPIFVVVMLVAWIEGKVRA